VRNLLLADDATLTSEFHPELLGGVQVVKGRVTALAYDDSGAVSRRAQDFMAIPYYAWANRGPGEMTVWIPNRPGNARPQPLSTVASRAKVTASPAGRDPLAVHDQNEPRSSRDPTDSFFHWWPEKGGTQWIEYELEKPGTVSAVEVYWFDDTGSGECRTPAAWRILYREGGDWKPVATTDGYGVEKDRYNRVAFKPVTASALRLEVTLQPQWSAGIQEWKVN